MTPIALLALGCAALSAWWDRCQSRDSWRYTLSMKFIGERAMAEDPLGRDKPWDP